MGEKMNKKLLKVLRLGNAVIFMGVFGWIGQVAADPMYFCVGEKDFNCSIKPVYDCGTDANGVAQSLCTATTPEGPKRLPYILNTVGIHDGNKCGYHMYRVDCLSGTNLSKLQNSSKAMAKFQNMEEATGIKALKAEK
jgi:hypothetical protein